MKIQGIYKIVNRLNNKICIGQSVGITKKFSVHKSKNSINYPYETRKNMSLCKLGKKRAKYKKKLILFKQAI